MLVIADRAFRTKGELQDYLRHLRESHALGQVVIPEHYALLHALLLDHPRAGEKIGPGVRHFFVDRSPKHEEGRAGKCFWIMREDGTTESFGAKRCFRPAASAQARFAQACRTAIVEQRRLCREVYFQVMRPIRSCVWTGRTLVFTDCHVHHLAPDTFANLLQRFVAEVGLDVSRVAISGGTDGVACTLADETLRSRWQTFHQQHARLAVLSRIEHEVEHGRLTPPPAVVETTT